MKVAIYCRVSTKEQNEELQLTGCHSINTYGEYDLYQDKQSAFKDHVDRQDFERLKSAIKQHRHTHLIVWDLDRIFRNRKKLIEFFEFCKHYGCTIHSYRQGWLEQLHKIQAPFNEIMHSLMLQIMGWLAEEESQKKSERVKAAVRRTGTITRSYKGNKWGRKGISKQKCTIIRTMRTQGSSIRSIATTLGLSVGVVHKIVTKSAEDNEAVL